MPIQFRTFSCSTSLGGLIDQVTPEHLRPMLPHCWQVDMCPETDKVYLRARNGHKMFEGRSKIMNRFIAPITRKLYECKMIFHNIQMIPVSVFYPLLEKYITLLELEESYFMVLVVPITNGWGTTRGA